MKAESQIQNTEYRYRILNSGHFSPKASCFAHPNKTSESEWFTGDSPN